MLVPQTSNFGIDFIRWLIIFCFQIPITLDMDINFQSNRDSELQDASVSDNYLKYVVMLRNIEAYHG